ncbi:MAG: hypothetical protein HQL30_07040 [Candidatus Omnitrophica bacterium]|nr:hypothetical protein [Candidatus Omnitrophota bacterium]
MERRAIYFNALSRERLEFVESTKMEGEDLLFRRDGKVQIDLRLKGTSEKELIYRVIEKENTLLIEYLSSEKRKVYQRIMRKVLYGRKSRIKDLYLNISPENSELKGRQLLNKILVKASTMVLMMRRGLLDTKELSENEMRFVEAMEKVFGHYGNNFFTGIFWDWDKRVKFIKHLLSAAPEDTGKRREEFFGQLGEEKDEIKEDLFKNAKALPPYLIVNEVFSRYLADNFHNYDMELFFVKIFYERPDLIEPEFVDMLVGSLGMRNMRKTLFIAKLLLIISINRPDLVPGELKELAVKKLSENEAHKDSQKEFAEYAYLQGSTDERVNDILKRDLEKSYREEKESGKKKNKDTPILVYYGARPGEITKEILEDMFEVFSYLHYYSDIVLAGKMKDLAVDVMFGVYKARPDLRPDFDRFFFTGMDGREFRKYHNAGKLMVLITEEFPEKKEPYGRMLKALLMKDKPRVAAVSSELGLGADGPENEFKESGDLDADATNAVVKILEEFMEERRLMSLDNGLFEILMDRAVKDSKSYCYLGLDKEVANFIRHDHGVVKPGMLKGILDLTKTDSLAGRKELARGIFANIENIAAAMVKADPGAVTPELVQYAIDLFTRKLEDIPAELESQYVKREDIQLGARLFSLKFLAAVIENCQEVPQFDFLRKWLKDVFDDPEHERWRGHISEPLLMAAGRADETYRRFILDAVLAYVKADTSSIDKTMNNLAVFIRKHPELLTDEMIRIVTSKLEISWNGISRAAGDFMRTVAEVDPEKHIFISMDELFRNLNTAASGDRGGRYRTDPKDLVKFFDKVIEGSKKGDITYCAMYLKRFGIKDEDMKFVFPMLFSSAKYGNIFELEAMLSYMTQMDDYARLREFLRLAYLYYRLGRIEEFKDKIRKVEGRSCNELIEDLGAALGGPDGDTDIAGQVDRRILEGWDGVERFLRRAIEIPVMADVLISKIIITMKFVRGGIGDDAGFGRGADIETRLPRIRRVMTELLQIEGISLLNKRNLLKVLSVGDDDLIEKLRQDAINMVVALGGRDGRNGLVGNIRNDIHNRPSPQHLYVVRLLRDWLVSNCSDENVAQSIRKCGYTVEASDAIPDAARRQRVINACNTALATLETVYGEGNLEGIGTLFNNWRGSFEGYGAEKDDVGSIVRRNYSGERRSVDDLGEIIRARGIVFELTRFTRGEAATSGIQLLNSLEVLFYSVYNRIEKDVTDLASMKEMMTILLRNTAFNGYDRNEIDAMLRDVEAFDPEQYGEEKYLRLYSLMNRAERLINVSAGKIIAQYQSMAERTARALNVGPDGEEWVENFSSNLFRSDTIYLLSMFLKDVKEHVMTEGGISGWQVVVKGDMRGRLRFIDDVRNQKDIQPSDIVVVKELPAESPPIENCAGIIIMKEESLLSHPAIRARQFNIPFVMCSDADTVEEMLKGYHDKDIIIRAGNDGLAITDLGDKIKEGSYRVHEVASAFTVPPVETDGEYLLSPGEYKLENAGNKALRLSGIRYGDKVPRHMAISFAFYKHILDLKKNAKIKEEMSYIEKRMGSADREELVFLLNLMKFKIKSLDIPEDEVKSICAKIKDELGGGLYFFRSSTNAEDLPRYAGAGLYDSFGNISPDDPGMVDEFIKKVWMSVWNERAYFDREANGIPHDEVGMSVLVHKMEKADYGFVVHTLDPVGEDPEDMVIEIVEGLGETLVSGEYPGSPHRFLINRKTREIKRISFANKSERLVSGAGGLVTERVSYDKDHFARPLAECKDILLRIFDSAMKIRGSFEDEQDMEGCISEEDGDLKFVFVQTRDQQGAEHNGNGHDVAERFDSYYGIKGKPGFMSLEEGLLSRGEALAGKKEYATDEYTEGLDKLAADEPMAKRGFIIFADEIINDALMLDIGRSVKRLTEEATLLKGMTFFIHYKDEKNAVLVERMIAGSGADIKVVFLAPNGREGKFTEEETVNSVIRTARAKGAGEILGVLKGPAGDPARMSDLSIREKIPFIIVGIERGLYSFEAVLMKALEIRKTGASGGWLYALPPVTLVTKEIKAEYEEYLSTLGAMSAA